MGVDMLGIAFVVVALGGLGNLLGAIAAGLLFGVAQAIVAAYWTEASTVVIYAVRAAVLLVRPQGLFGIRLKKKVSCCWRPCTCSRSSSVRRPCGRSGSSRSSGLA